MTTTPKGPVWEVAEGISGTFYYHVRDVSLPRPLSQPAPCGARVMQTQIPLSTWGHVGHLKERWCEKCAAHAGLTKEDPK
jgi:hypothetical protein